MNLSLTMFVVPFTLVVVELLKNFGLETKWLALSAVIFGFLAGFGHGVYYHQDILVSSFNGFLAGASATGLYRTVQKLGD